MKYLYFFKTCLLLLIIAADMSSAEILMVNDQYTVIEEIEHIPITSEVSIGGHRLCTDGQHLKFKDFKSCKMVQTFLETHGGFAIDCSGDLKISPVAELELIYTRSGRTLQRFYQTKMQYEVVRKERVLGSTTNDFEIVSRRQLPLSLCRGLQKKPLVYLKNERESFNSFEDSLIEALLKNNVSVVNKEQGPLYQNLPKPNEPPSSTFLTLQTPICNRSLTPRDIQQALGGWTGTGGGQSFDMGQLQDLSRPLKITKTPQRSSQFAMTCE